MTAEPTSRPAAPPAVHHLSGGADAEDVDAGYLAKRQLRTGTAGWVRLGVSAVISGDYAGWNCELAEGGFGGLRRRGRRRTDRRWLAGTGWRWRAPRTRQARPATVDPGSSGAGKSWPRSSP